MLIFVEQFVCVFDKGQEHHAGGTYDANEEEDLEQVDRSMGEQVHVRDSNAGEDADRAR